MAKFESALLVVLASGVMACSGAVQGTSSTQAGDAVVARPSPVELLPSESVRLVADATPSAGASVVWSVAEAGGGSIDANGNYTAPSGTGTFHVVARVATVSGQAEAIVTGTPRIAVYIYQRAPAVPVGGTLAFTATVTGSLNDAVTWAVQEGATGGRIDAATGVYTAPSTSGTYHVVATSAADTTKQDVVPVTVGLVPLPPPQHATYLGGHIAEIFNAQPPVYANMLATSWPWQDMGGGILVETGRLDDNGNPTIDAFKIGFLNTTSVGPTSLIGGTYKLSFNGQASVSLNGGGSVQNVAYDAATNTTTADVIVPSSGPNYVLQLANAWRRADHAADATGNTRGITNARLMAPGHSFGTDYWYKDVVALRNAYSLMRFEWALGPGYSLFSHNGSITGVMGSGDTTWSTRARPGFYGYSYKGMPWEDIVLFANLTGMDVWINIPIGADNDYVTKVFQLLKYGSDGKNPYTAQTHDPASWAPGLPWYPGLVEGRKVYVEFSNELFSYYAYGDPQARADIGAGDPHHLNWDGHGGGDRWNMWNVVRISLLARQVWGDAAMQNQIRIVYAGQGDWGNWGRHQYGMDYLSHVWGPSSPWDTIDGFTNPRQPVSYYLYAVAGSFYVHCNNAAYVPNETSVDQFFANANTSLSVNGGLPGFEGNSVYQRIGFGQAMAERYGIKFATYETGLEIFQYGAVGAAWSDPRMTTLYYNLLHQMVTQPNADVAVQSATVRGISPGNNLSMSWSASDGYPWPRDGAAAPTRTWQAVMSVAAGQ